MKIKLFPFVLLILIAFGANSFLVQGQDVAKKENYKIKIIEINDGEEIEIDTTFSSKEAADKFLQSRNIDIESGEMLDIMMDESENEKIVVNTKSDSEEDEDHAMIFISDDGEVVEITEDMDDAVWHVKDNGDGEKKYVVKTKSKGESDEDVLVFYGDEGDENHEIHHHDGDWSVKDGETIIIKTVKGEDGEEYKTIDVEIEDYKDGDDNSETVKVEVDDDGNVIVTKGDGTIETISSDDADKEVIIKKVIKEDKKCCDKHSKKDCKTKNKEKKKVKNKDK